MARPAQLLPTHLSLPSTQPYAREPSLARVRVCPCVERVKQKQLHSVSQAFSVPCRGGRDLAGSAEADSPGLCWLEGTPREQGTRGSHGTACVLGEGGAAARPLWSGRGRAVPSWEQACPGGWEHMFCVPTGSAYCLQRVCGEWLL